MHVDDDWHEIDGHKMEHEVDIADYCDALVLLDFTDVRVQPAPCSGCGCEGCVCAEDGEALKGWYRLRRVPPAERKA